MKTIDQLQRVLSIKESDLAQAKAKLANEDAFKKLYLEHFGNVLSENNGTSPKMADIYNEQLISLQEAKIRVLQLEEQIKIIKWIIQ